MVMPGWINDCVYCLTWRWASAACLWSFQTSSQIVSFAFLSSGVWRQIAERLKIMSTPLSQIGKLVFNSSFYMNVHISLFWVFMLGTMWKYTVCKNFFNWNCGRIGLLFFLFSISLSFLFSTTSTFGSGVAFTTFAIFSFFILFAFGFYFGIVSFG